MTNGEGGAQVLHLDIQRLERLTNAVALASAGAYDEATEALHDFEPDRFGVVSDGLFVAALFISGPATLDQLLRRPRAGVE